MEYKKARPKARFYSSVPILLLMVYRKVYQLKSTLNCDNILKFNSSFSSYVSPSLSGSTKLSLWLIIKCRFNALGEQNRKPAQIGH